MILSENQYYTITNIILLDIQILVCISPVPEFIVPVFSKTSPKQAVFKIENERFGFVFAKLGL